IVAYFRPESLAYFVRNSQFNQTFYFFAEKKCGGLPRLRASVGVNQKIFENLQRPRRLRGFPTRAVGTTLIRFSIFSESGLKHCLGCLFPCLPLPSGQAGLVHFWRLPRLLSGDKQKK
ncbi:MAG TPA: hypothetical protein PKN41_03345, partial [Bacteroidales bacterium]|nr:hypothetical protein [Bacteroidales bacterium]